jgi:hypothetical protein
MTCPFPFEMPKSLLEFQGFAHSISRLENGDWKCYNHGAVRIRKAANEPIWTVTARGHPGYLQWWASSPMQIKINGRVSADTKVELLEKPTACGRVIISDLQGLSYNVFFYDRELAEAFVEALSNAISLLKTLC